MKAFIARVGRLARGGQLVADQRGLSTVEYVIILVVVAALAVTAWNKFGEQVRAKLQYSNDQMKEVGGKDLSDGSGGP